MLECTAWHSLHGKEFTWKNDKVFWKRSSLSTHDYSKLVKSHILAQCETMAFSKCGWIHLYLKKAYMRIPGYILSRYEVYLQCGLLYVLSNLLWLRMPFHIFHLLQQINEFSNCLFVRMTLHILNKLVTYHYCKLIDVFSLLLPSTGGS